jgi:ribonuclease P protein component
LREDQVKPGFRLKQSSDFKRVRSSGRSYAHPLLVLVASPAPAPRIRIGVTAGKNVGGAVQRNRVKRLMREAFGALLPGLEPGWDIVAIARRPLTSADLAQTREALSGLLVRAHLLKADE